MPDPIPRNRSALGPAPRRPEKHGLWRLFRRPRGNPGQPPPRGPRHAARQEAWPDRLFRRPQGNAGQPRPPRSQPRHAARQEARPDRLFRRSRGNAGRPGPAPPRTPTQPRTEVVVGVVILAVAVLAGIVVLRLLPSESSSASPADPPVSDRADVPAAGGGNPGPASGQLTAPPGALAGLDGRSTHEGEALARQTAVHRGIELPGIGLPVAADRRGPAAPPVRPSEPASGADLGRLIDSLSVDRGQQGPIASLWHLLVGSGTDEIPVQSPDLPRATH